eukprot:gene29297-33087_t
MITTPDQQAVDAAITSRRSIRAFLPAPVAREDLEQLLQVAARAKTLTLVAVYVPLAFAPGRTGRLFTEFALALAGAVTVSGVVALTLSPMMSSVLL